tara:strand:+ start:1140 stop:2348 length:1209 start_codon:yes stop_codon:yes gene_type:complete
MQRFKFKISLIIFVLALLALSLDLFSHQRSESYSKWVVDNQGDQSLINITFTIRLSNLNSLEGPLIGEWQKKVSDKIISSFSTNPECSIGEKNIPIVSKENDIFRISWTLICSSELEKINTDIFFNQDPTHSHIARYINDTNLSIEKLFTSQTRTWNLKDIKSQNNEVNSSFKEYVLLGIKHISTGYDHLTFLLGLLLLNPGTRRLLLAITGFTLGHSLTLSLAVLDLVRPVGSFVEALIGYSIALLGLELLIRRRKDSSVYICSAASFLVVFFLLYLLFFDRSFILGLFGLFLFTICYFLLVKDNSSIFFSLVIASIFGLIHGFGFGGFLFEVGFSEENLLKALFGFNLGVELGQILAVIIFLSLFYVLGKLKIMNQSFFNPILATFLVSIGTYWFVYRII